MPSNVPTSNSKKRPTDNNGGVNAKRTSEASANKRAKVAPGPSPADDLICPITLELPWDPVNAEDGQHYERAAIEKHIKMNEGKELRSPVLNKKMGPRLTPAPKIKSLIETLIRTRAITGELAKKWKKLNRQNDRFHKHKQKAEAGDVDSMFKLGEFYWRGYGVTPTNTELAFEWLQKAHMNGDLRATRGLGFVLSTAGKFKVNAVMYTSMAAAKGSKVAALNLSRSLICGMDGLAFNKEETIYWLRQSVSSDGVGMALPEKAKQTAQKMLQKLIEGDADLQSLRVYYMSLLKEEQK